MIIELEDIVYTRVRKLSKTVDNRRIIIFPSTINSFIKNDYYKVIVKKDGTIVLLPEKQEKGGEEE